MRGRSLGLGLIAATAAFGLACDDGGPVQRGFGSQQLVQLRDPTFSFHGTRRDLVYYMTGVDSSGHGTPNYWSIDVGTGEVKDLGSADPSLDPPTSTARYQCGYSANAEGLFDILNIADTQTQQLTVIQNVVMTFPYCPADDDPTMIIWRREPDATRTMWTGPFDNLQQVALPIVVHQTLWHDNGRSLVSAPSPTMPAGLGIYSVADQDPTVATELVPAALAQLAWAPGATPSAALASAGLPEKTIFWPAGPGHYSYARAMDDYSRVMFVGPYDTGGPRELALFPVGPDEGLTPLNIEPYNFRYDGTWRLTTAWTSVVDDTHWRLRIWRDAIRRLATCPWSSAREAVSIGDPLDENALVLAPQPTPVVPEGFPLLLVVPSLDGDAACKTLATASVGWADFSPDATALAWLVEPGDLNKSTLWRAGRDGSGPRSIGTGLIWDPRFVGDSQLEFINDGDLVWVDVNDDSASTHFVTEQVFGTAIDLGRWTVTGHDYSDQDSNGPLALVNRDTGETRPISPAVAMYTTPDVRQRGTTIGVFMENGSPVRIVYLVRGRNPSSQDGIWVATITPQDRQ